MVAHRAHGECLLERASIAEGREHLDQALALYDAAEHRPLATRFGQDVGVHALSYRSWAKWLLGYPEAALTDAERALRDAREIGQAATLMHALATRAGTPYLAETTPQRRRSQRAYQLGRRKEGTILGRQLE